MAEAHPTADPQVCHGVGQVAGAASAAQAGIGRLLRVQGRRQRGRKVQIGQIRQGPSRVEGGRDQRQVGRLVWGREDAVGRREEEEKKGGRRRGKSVRLGRPYDNLCEPGDLSHFPLLPAGRNLAHLCLRSYLSTSGEIIHSQAGRWKYYFQEGPQFHQLCPGSLQVFPLL